MKSLVICTDFSDTSLNAAKYGCMMAARYKISNIILLHAYQTFIPTLSLPVIPNEAEDIYESSLFRLDELKRELKTLTDPVTVIKTRAENITLAESINRICEEEYADFVVVGMKEKSKLEKSITGSNSIDIAENSSCPVMIVPADADFKTIDHVLIACSLKKVAETIPEKQMQNVLDLFNVRLTVLNIDHNDKHFTTQTPDDMMRLHKVFDRYHPEYAFSDNKDIVSGILEYAEKQNASLIIAIPKNYNLIRSIFHRSTTEQLIYQSSIPILSLHSPKKGG